MEVLRMILRNGHESVCVVPEDFTLVSTDRDGLILPFHHSVWGELQTGISNAIFERANCSDLDSYLEHASFEELYVPPMNCMHMEISFNIQPHEVRSILIIHVMSPLSGKFTMKRLLSMRDDEISCVLDHYFTTKAIEDLNAGYAAYIRKNYAQWRKLKKVS